jgi:hypothetical protein
MGYVDALPDGRYVRAQSRAVQPFTKRAVRRRPAMRLFSGKVTTISEEIVRTLTGDGDIEAEQPAEVVLDIESVLKEYLRFERSISEEAKNRMELRGLPYAQLGKLRNQVAKEKGAPQSDDVLPYLIDQILHILFHSRNVEEIFAEDTELRKKVAPVMRKHMDVGGELDEEVRSKIKNLEEGTATFEIEYQRIMGDMKRKKGLT